ncbi:MAG: hypothetical protein ACJ8FU_08360 [Xanthobacteraceae bacterium]
MEHASHTAAPWSVYDQDDFQKQILICTLRSAANYDSPVAEKICWTEKNPFFRGTDGYAERKARDLANARLIAAAPDLLAALKLANDEIHHPGAARHEGIDLDAIISAALAKAEGGR